MSILDDLSDFIQDLLCLDLSHIIGGRDRLRLDLRLTVALDLFEFVDFLAFDETERASGSSGTTCTADTVYIIFIVLRQIIVKYCLDIVNIDSARCHIRSDQNIASSASETLHHTVSLLLLHVSVNAFRCVASSLQFRSKLIDHTLRVAEYKGKLRIVVIQQTCQHIHLVVSAHIIIILINARNRQFLFCHLDRLCILLILLGNLQDRLWHRCGKKHGLPVLILYIRKDRLDILAESHVEHLICLIENKRVNIVAADRLAAQMIHDTSRRSDDDRCATL